MTVLHFADTGYHAARHFLAKTEFDQHQWVGTHDDDGRRLRVAYNSEGRWSSGEKAAIVVLAALSTEGHAIRWVVLFDMDDTYRRAAVEALSIFAFGPDGLSS